jgi:hypothetical protein
MIGVGLPTCLNRLMHQPATATAASARGPASASLSALGDGIRAATVAAAAAAYNDDER